MPAWGDDPNRLKAPASEIARVEAQIAQVPPDQRSTYQLSQLGIQVPPGYRLEPNGRLKYVAVDNSQHWYNDPKVMLPLVIGGGAALGGAVGGAAGGAAGGSAAADGGLAASMGAPAATEAAIFGTPAATASNAMWNAGGSVLGGTGLGSKLGNGAKNMLGGDDGAPDWLRAAMAGMAGIPGLLASRQGPSDDEQALIAQAQRILGQQEARTKYADPLYKATMQMAYGLLPNRPGGYPED